MSTPLSLKAVETAGTSTGYPSRFAEFIGPDQPGIRLRTKDRFAIRPLLAALASCDDVFVDGDMVKLQVCASPGHILLLSDGPDGLSCLSPSTLLPSINVEPGDFESSWLPEQPQRWLPVGGPRGSYHLLCFSTTRRLPSRLHRRLQEQQPTPMAPVDVDQTYAWLKQQGDGLVASATRYVVL